MDSPGGGGSGSTISRRRRMQLAKQHSKESKEFVYAETFRPQRQPPPPGCDDYSSDTSLEDRPLLSSARPLVAPREKIQRTPSREVDPETESSFSEPQPTPVSVVGPVPPKFMVEIASPTTAQSSGFYIENISSRATVSASVPEGSSNPPVSQVTVTTPSIQKPIIIPPPTILSSSVTPPVTASQQQAVVRAVPQQATPPTVARQPMASPVAMQPTMAAPAAAAPAAKPAMATASPSCENAVLTLIQELPYQTLGPFIALICGGGFIAAATQLDPTWLVLLTSLASFILFRVLRI